MRRALQRLLAQADEQVDAASLRFFRAGFGVLLAVALVRLHLTGWTGPLFLEPTFRFEYAAFSFVPAVPAPLVPWLLAVGAVGALGLGFGRGLWRRAGGLLFLACFGWLKLFDVTNYLNHDYLAFILGAFLALLPLDGASVPRWAVWLLRVQVGLVYVHAGLAKVNSDWLLEGQPLTIWFAANRGLPVLGPLLGLSFAPVLASWAACLYDCTIPFWLSWRRTRPYAFVVVLLFHGLTHALFDIGIFPFLMTLAATVFFEPSWARRFIPGAAPHEARAATPRWVLGLAAAWLAFQVTFPLRSHLIGDDVLWDEQGMRWSWKVMLREKNGSISYRVRLKGQSREWELSPREVLTLRQANEMSGQPDLIVALGKRLGAMAEARFGRPVELYVDALVSLNGRPPQRLIRPDVDLMQLEPSALPSALLPSPRLASR